MEELQAEVEDLEKKRTKWLIINLIGFCIWGGIRIIDNHLLDNHSSPILTGAMLFGWMIWIVGLVQILLLGKRVGKKRVVLQIFNDELIQLKRFKTWRIALVAVVLTQVCLIVASQLTEISGLFGAELSIYVSVVSAIGSFLFFNSESNA